MTLSPRARSHLYALAQIERVFPGVVEVDTRRRRPVSVSATPGIPPVSPMVDAIRERMRVRDSILLCTRCELRQGCVMPVPFRGPTPARLAIVGEAPGSVEDMEGRPFVGPAGRLFYRLMEEEGVDLAEAFFCNAVSCYPNIGAPGPAHLTACSGHLMDQINLADPEIVLLVGQTALNQFLPDVPGHKAQPVRIGRMSGRTWWDGARSGRSGGASWIMMAVVHPSAVLRSGEQWESVFRKAAHALSDVLGGGPPAQYAPEACVRCGGDWTASGAMDSRGLPYCERHKPATQESP